MVLAGVVVDELPEAELLPAAEVRAVMVSTQVKLVHNNRIPEVSMWTPTELHAWLAKLWIVLIWSGQDCSTQGTMSDCGPLVSRFDSSAIRVWISNSPPWATCRDTMRQLQRTRFPSRACSGSS